MPMLVFYLGGGGILAVVFVFLILVLINTIRSSREDTNKLPPIEAEAIEMLNHMNYKNTANSLGAAGWFAKHTPTDNKELQAIAARRLIDIAENGEALMIGAAAAGLPNWATEEIAPRMLKRVQGNPGFDRHHHIEALGRLKYVPAVPDLIRLIKSGQDREVVKKALIGIGTVAEPAVLKVLTDNDLAKEIRRENLVGLEGAVPVLGYIGTSESLPALQKLKKTASRDNRSLSNLAANAIESISERIESAK